MDTGSRRRRRRRLCSSLWVHSQQQTRGSTVGPMERGAVCVWKEGGREGQDYMHVS